jgi:hypothetical protein
MVDPVPTTSLPSGFPVELRPLLVLVIVLAIGHMLLRMRVRKGPPARRAGKRASVQHAREAAPIKGGRPPAPADALAALRRQADEGTQRP